MPELRRRYDASGRQARARAGRGRILQTARRLFTEHGYAATPVARIAREAGVSAPTVFAAFGSKAELLKEAVDTAIAGDGEPVALVDRPALLRVRAAGDLDEALHRLAGALGEVAGRAGPIAAVAYAAADSDPEIARLVADLDSQRLAGAAHYARMLAPHLDRPIDVDRLRDGLWALLAPHNWDLLVRRQGWPAEAYRAWLEAAMRGLCG